MGLSSKLPTMQAGIRKVPPALMEAISWLIGWAIIKLIVSEKLDDHEFLSMLPWLVEVADVVPSITSIT